MTHTCPECGKSGNFTVYGRFKSDGKYYVRRQVVCPYCLWETQALIYQISDREWATSPHPVIPNQRPMVAKEERYAFCEACQNVTLQTLKKRTEVRFKGSQYLIHKYWLCKKCGGESHSTKLRTKK